MGSFIGLTPFGSKVTALWIPSRGQALIRGGCDRGRLFQGIAPHQGTRTSYLMMVCVV
jgi:hypothetical protein